MLGLDKICVKHSEVIHETEDDETKASVFSMILQFFDDQQIKEACEAMRCGNITAERIQELVFMHSLLAKCAKAGISMSPKLYKLLVKDPAKTIAKMLEGMSDTQDGLLIVMDLCIRFEIDNNQIWLVLFETIREYDLLLDRLTVLNWSKWFNDLHHKSKQLYDNYHKAWNNALVSVFETDPQKSILGWFS